MQNKIFHGDWIDIAKGLPARSMHCIITSPPYWGQRNYHVEGQLGLEKTPEEHIEKLVIGFRALRRILRDDGTLWVNYGTKMCDEQDLLLASRLALSLQEDDWIFRSDIIWAKALSMCLAYSGSTMPESVNGWRWERCRVKVGNRGRKQSRIEGHFQDHSGNEVKTDTQWQDCPGCKKCRPNGGYVLRKGSWRPTRAHEYVLMFAKRQGYYCDMEAVKEDVSGGTHDPGTKLNKPSENAGIGHEKFSKYCPNLVNSRNLRDVWVINPQPWGRAHYATFPEKLVELIIKVATSQKGVCPKCGAPWARVVDSRQVKRERPSDRTDRHNQGDGVNSCGNTVAGTETTTLDWRATCNCKWYRLKKNITIPQPIIDMVNKAGSENDLIVEKSDIPNEWMQYFEEANTMPTQPAVVFDPFHGLGHCGGRSGPPWAQLHGLRTKPGLHQRTISPANPGGRNRYLDVRN